MGSRSGHENALALLAVIRHRHRHALHCMPVATFSGIFQAGQHPLRPGIQQVVGQVEPMNSPGEHVPFIIHASFHHQPITQYAIGHQLPRERVCGQVPALMCDRHAGAAALDCLADLLDFQSADSQGLFAHDRPHISLDRFDGLRRM